MHSAHGICRLPVLRALRGCSLLLKISLVPGTPLNAGCDQVQISLAVGGDGAPALGLCALGNHVDVLQLQPAEDLLSKANEED